MIPPGEPYSVAFVVLASLLFGCGARSGLDEGVGERDASAPVDAAVDAPDPDDGGCGVAPLGVPEPPWVTSECPASGCPAGSVCVSVFGPFLHPMGCAPIPVPCGGVATCACMGCICGSVDGCGGLSGQPGLACTDNLP